MAEVAVVNHVGQCVADLERATRFYVELLGFEVDRTLDVPDRATSALLGVAAPCGLRAVYLRLGSFQLELMAFTEGDHPGHRPRVFDEPGLTHLSVSVADLPATRDRVADLGGEVVTDLGVAVVVRDPDGQFVELLPMDYRRQLDGEG